MIRLTLHGGLREAERGGLEKFAELVDILGTRTVGISVNVNWTEKQVETIRQFLDDRQIRVGEAAWFYPGLVHRDSQIRNTAIAQYKKKIRYASILGAHGTGFAPGTCNPPDSNLWLHKDNRSEETWQRFIQSTRELAKVAESCEVTLAAHPQITSPLCSIERMRRLVDEADSSRVKILLDPVNITTIDAYFNMAGFINQIFDELGDYIVALHAKDVTIYSVSDWGAPWRQSIFHVNEEQIGKGILDYDTVLRRLDGLSGDPLLIIEHVKNDDETILAKHYFEYIARKNGMKLG